MNPFQRRPEPSAELATAHTELDRVSRDYKELETAVRSMHAVLDAMFLIPIVPAPLPPDAQGRYETAWAEQRPAFSALPPILEPRELHSRGLAIAKVLRSKSDQASNFATALKRGRIDLERWASLWLAGDSAGLLMEAAEQGIDSESATSLFRYALMPSLASITRRAEAPERWRSSSCPFCGGEALLGEIRGLDGGRFLRCGLCAADWGIERMGCPSCGEADHRRLQSLGVEGEVDRRRLFLCETCGLRLKVVQTLSRLSPPSLVVAELSTIHLNFL